MYPWNSNAEALVARKALAIAPALTTHPILFIIIELPNPPRNLGSAAH